MKKNRIYYLPDEFMAKNFAPSMNAVMVETSYFKRNVNDFKNSIFFVRGITNNKYCKMIKEIGSNYFYIDTGYFGNFNTYYKNNGFAGKKVFHRIAFNAMQMSSLENFDDSRYKETLRYIKRDFDIDENDFLKPWKKEGKRVLICPPSDKVGFNFGIDVDDWINKIEKQIKRNSDRRILVRKKPQSRSERVKWNTIQASLDDDIFILVTYNSIAATEAIIHGIPAVTLGLNAATPVSVSKIEEIENPVYPDRQLWLNNLAFGQFHTEELRNGVAWNCIKRHIL